MVYVKLLVSIISFLSIWFFVCGSETVQDLLPIFGYLGITAFIAHLSWQVSCLVTSSILRSFPVIDPKKYGILITGCDSGFGKLAALQANRLGFFVFAGSLMPNESDLPFLSKDSSRMKILDLDVTNRSHVLKAFDRVVTELDKSVDGEQLKLFAIVNCAGIMKLGGIEYGMSGCIDDYEEQMEVNCFGAIRVTKTFLPLIRESKGRVIIISSMMSRLATPASNAYSVSKAALSKFTEGLQIEMDPFGVNVVGIEPWFDQHDYKRSTYGTLLQSVGFYTDNC
jgi:3-hydroxybutyrate dehydrogenase